MLRWGLFYFTCSEEFLLLLRIRGMELAKKTRLWGVSGDCYLTCQEKSCISWGISSSFSLNGPLKSKSFGDQWSEETALVHLELSCIYLAKLELYLPEFPSLQSSGGIAVSFFVCIFCIRSGRNHQSSLLLCQRRKPGVAAGPHPCCLPHLSQVPLAPVCLQGQVDDVMRLEAVRSSETHILSSSWFPACFHSFLL